MEFTSTIPVLQIYGNSTVNRRIYEKKANYGAD